TPPNVPTILSVNAQGCNQIFVSWTASSDVSTPHQQVSGVAGYKVYRGGSYLAFVTVTSLTDTGLSGNTHYGYQVSADDHSTNETALSTVVSTGTPPCNDTSPPTVPVVTISAPNCSQVVVSWTPSTDPSVAGQASTGVSGYNIYSGGSLLGFVNGTT